MSSINLRRLGAVVAGGAVVASGLVAAGPTGSAHALVLNAPTVAAVDWLEAQLTEDDVFGTEASNVTATIDFGVGLARSGADGDVLARIVDGVDGALATYVGSSGDLAKSARVAKAAAFYALAGESLTRGEIDLQDRLETVVGDDGGLDNDWGGDDYFNQSAAVLALDAVGSEETNAATEFLLAGQCATDGGWGYLDTFTDPGNPACVADADTTAVALLGLVSQNDDEDVAAAIAEGVAYLEGQQAADGSFGETFFTPFNTNSTGLAGWALSEAGTTESAADAAEAAAVWVRRHQLTGLACDGAAVAEAGMLSYSDQALTDELGSGVTDRARAISATAQAFPVLLLAPAATGDVTIKAPRWVKAGTSVTVRAAGLAPGERDCVVLAGGNGAAVGDADGNGSASIAVPPTTRNYKAALRTVGGANLTTPVTALAPKVLTVLRGTSRVAAGGQQAVRITGLVPGEKATIRYGKVVVGTGVANANGAFRVTFAVGRAKGTKTVTGRGLFNTRRGAVTFRVV
ncbi:hypothetical protein ACFQ0K_12065 [Nocardioides caeni]|uniref:Squalene cyclase C-terminal domain-containing protein n=1 Tax=Nocardioides caeni TaxID=574700 RepID=A0A4S8NML6_9ACTN|nr:hypothetical protein [Nocardioides caeni]THV17825.1 hypothetical protein E9934_05005 [Nocardioides caeni]